LKKNNREAGMTPVTVRYFALISAVNARVAGMQAENQHRLSCGNSIAYGNEAFECEAAYLESLALEVLTT
jgi:hypothetical protein